MVGHFSSVLPVTPVAQSTVPEPLRAFFAHADAVQMFQGLKRPLRLCSKAVTASKFLFINYDF